MKNYRLTILLSLLSFVIGVALSFWYVQDRITFFEQFSMHYAGVAYQRGCSEAKDDSKSCIQKTRIFVKDQNDISLNFDNIISNKK